MPVTLDDGRTINVIRDDALEGGTKSRGLPALFGAYPEVSEWVYASPTTGYAQIALAYCAKQTGRKATVFVPKRAKLSPYTQRAIEWGADIRQVNMGFLKNCQRAAARYVEGQANKACRLVPFGVNHPAMTAEITKAAKLLPEDPKEVWCVFGSGTLTRSLQKAWPNAEHNIVLVGREPSMGETGIAAHVFRAKEGFSQNAKIQPPFTCVANYDAKAWQFVLRYAEDGAYFWNVGAEIK